MGGRGKVVVGTPEQAPVIRPGAPRRPRVPGLGGVLPAAMAPGADRLGRAGAGRLRPELVQTLHGAWLVLRANQLWAPYPDNHPERAVACMRAVLHPDRELSTVSPPTRPRPPSSRSTGGACTARASAGTTRAAGNAEPPEELVESLTRLYRYLYNEPESAMRPAVAHRARAMDLSDEWIRQGCRPDSELLPLEHAALVRCYAALLAAVHH